MRGAYIKPLLSQNIDQSIKEWFFKHYPNYFLTVHPVITDGIIDKTALDPFEAQLLILYNTIDDTFVHIKGFMLYDSDDVTAMPPKNQPIINSSIDIIEDGFVLPWEYQKSDGVECSLDDICHRVDWILGKEKTLKHNKEELSYTTCKILLKIGHLIPQFHKMQIERERAFLIDQLKPYTQNDESMKKLLLMNYPEVYFIEPTLMDLQACYKDFTLRRRPSLWVSVHLTDIPTELAAKKILYSGGKVHLHRNEIPDWICRITFRSAGKRIKEIPEQLNVVMAHIASGINNNNKSNNNVARNPVMAPCIERIAKGNTFPTDTTRQHLVSTLKFCGFTLEFVEEMLDRLNEKDPHRDGPYITTKRRWDYAIYYKKGYAPPKCEDMDCYCPFTGGGSIDKKKMACHATFKERYPDKFKDNQARIFYGPASWSLFF